MFYADVYAYVIINAYLKSIVKNRTCTCPIVGYCITVGFVLSFWSTNVTRSSLEGLIAYVKEGHQHSCRTSPKGAATTTSNTLLLVNLGFLSLR